ncbi:hypothetical protein IO99_05485 [Clostridium sulfidigenes]|uniref:Uncharacterized protein n=1 Tax=Clostridium sulfidigenes TaxID=318464 RepID=A0A084JEZ2_9CLOT|nr:hypothetical protein [Clostridium sulfidigenes]KEZ87526.1 hypothetical protein IO99_05485 [Clostridium sulfidigenes]
MNCPNCNVKISNKQKILLLFKSHKCNNCKNILKLSVESKLLAIVPLLIATFIPFYWKDTNFRIMCIIIAVILAILITIKFSSVDNCDKQK